MAQVQWTEATFFAELRKHGGEPACAAARGILAWCQERGYDVAYGRGAKWGTLKPCVYRDGRTYVLFEAFTEGFVLLASYLWDEPPFTGTEARRQLIRRLNGLPLKQPLPEGAYNDRPRVPLAAFAAENDFAGLADAHDWVVGQIRA